MGTVKPRAGAVVLVDWRRGALPGEPTKIRPSIVVDEQGRFPSDYANIIVVPMSSKEMLVVPTFSERIDPTPENGAPVASWALAHHVSMVSLQRVKVTQSRITDEQLASLRHRIALALGIDHA